MKNIPEPLFDEKNVNKTTFRIAADGAFIFSPGDYSIPVFTYCMKSMTASPKAHVYTLDELKGEFKKIVQKINLDGISKYSPTDIQILYWSMLSGVSFSEMTQESKVIINELIPEYQDEFEESFLKVIEGNLKNISSLPEEIESTIEVPPHLEKMFNFRKQLIAFGNDYEKLINLVDTSTSKLKNKNTNWSKLSKNIYARFITDGRFGEIGFLQIRILSDSGRMINSEHQEMHSLDITSLIANPNDPDIQPLSLSPLYGIAGVISKTGLSYNPRVAVLLISLSLAAYPMNWDHFFELGRFFKDLKDKNIENEIKKGNAILRKEHDELEKPLKDTSIISGQTKNTSKKEGNKVRQYSKPGGVDQLNKDFDKIKGESSKSEDGLDLKTLSDGTTIVKRPKSDQGPTLEVQPSKDSSKYPDQRIRVKVRYL